MSSYPTFTPTNEIAYKIGNFKQYVPPFVPDTVMIRPYGEYGMSLGGVFTKLNGGYAVNANSYVADGAAPAADLPYLIQTDLNILPGVKKVIIALHWYSSIDQSSPVYNQIAPAIGPEVQAWNWYQPGPSEYSVYPWTRANALYLKATHQVWPTPDDNYLVQGIQYLMSQGYEVGLCPIATMLSSNVYAVNGGEWEVDRTFKTWTDPTLLANYLGSYAYFYQHYINLCAANGIRPWIFYIGYGMRDLTGVNSSPLMQQVVTTLQGVANACKQQLPNTLTTYAADLDEYYYLYLVRQNNCYLDALWTTPSLDFVGINWFAPLAVDDSEDSNLLQQNVLMGEGENWYLPGFSWRGFVVDRLIDRTTFNFKTGIAQTPISPLLQGVKDIIDWISFYHYTPAQPMVLAGVTPLPGVQTGSPLLCSQIHGVGPVGSKTVLSPTIGGIAPIPDLKDTWLQIQLHSYCSLNFPATIPDNTVFNFDFTFAIDPTLTDLTGNYRLFATEFGMFLDSLNGTITLWLRHQDGSYQSFPLFYAPSGDVSLVYTPVSVKILVDGAADMTVTPTKGTLFQVPTTLNAMWLGNPTNGVGLPKGYGVWQGKIYFLSILLGAAQANQSGGSFYFDDAYSGIRTAWNPNSKPWMATAFGYGSVRGSAADPHTRAETLIYAPVGSAVPDWYGNYTKVVSAIFKNGYKIWNIQGPYGSTFDIDQIYQAIVCSAACLGLVQAGAQHQVAWFFDTRNGGAYVATAPDGTQIYNDAYDYDLNAVLNSKAVIRDNGTRTINNPLITVDQDLGLSIVPGPNPRIRSILVQPGTPQK
jgi:hypothetical protein